MADAKRTIELVFEGVDNTAAATQAALNNTKNFASNLQSATQPVADFTFAALKVEAALLATGAAITAFSVSLASDFQSSLADLAKVLSDTDDIEQYKDLAIELGEAYGVSSNEVLQSIANYKQAGFTAEEAGQLTRAGLDLVIAGGVEAATSSDLLVASLKGFGAQAGEAAGIVDLLNEVSNNYATNVQELLTGFAALSPVAKTAGFSLQETIAVLTPGIEVYRSGSEAANGLKTSLLRLVDDSKPVSEALASIGVSQRDANGELRSARDIYFDVAKELSGLDENQRLFIASQLAGINQAGKFLAVTDGLNKTLEITSDNFKFAGSAAKEVALQLATAEIATNRAKVALTNLFTAIGTPVLDEYTGAADAITAIVQAIRDSAESDTGVGNLVALIQSQFADLQGTLEAVAENIPAALEQADFSGFTDGVEAIRDAIDSLFGGVDLSTVDGLAAAITAVGDAFNGLSQFSAGVIDSFKPLADAFFDIGSGIGDIDEKAFRSAGELAGFTTQLNLLSGPVITVAAALVALNQALAIGGAARAATVALGAVGGGGLIGALGKLSLFGAAGAAGFTFGTVINEQVEKITGTSLSTWVTDQIIALGLIDDQATNVVAALNDLPDALYGVTLNADETAKAIADADAEMENIARNSYEATDTTYNFADALNDAEAKLDALGNSGELLPKLYGDIDKTAAATDKLNAASAKNELEKQLKIIEAQSSIMVAAIEGDAKKAVAAFESISGTIQNTGDLLGDLFGNLNDAENFRDRFQIEDQIKLENERRQEALDLQRKQALAELRLARLKEEALRNGGATLNVQADGLAPHLEAIWREILDYIQVQVNAGEGNEFLLGPV